MTGMCVLLEDIVKGRMSPVTVGTDGAEKTIDVLKYANHIDVPAPVDNQEKPYGNINSIPLAVEEDMNKMRFFYFRGDFNEEKLAEIAKIVQDDYEIETGTFRDDKAIEAALHSYGIYKYEIKDVVQGEKDNYETVEEKALSIPMNIQVVSDGKKIFFNYSVNYGPFVFSDIAKTVEPYYEKASGTVRNEDELEKIIEDFGKTFGIEREYLVSAVHLGLDGRSLTPPPSIIYDFEKKKYHADENGFIHIPEDDPVVRAIIKMILEGKQGFVDKTVIETYEDLKKGGEPAS